MSKQEIDLLKRTLQNAQKQGLTRDIIDCYNALGEEYRKKGDEESLRIAIEYHELELKNCEENDLVFESACSCRFLGDVYRDSGDIQSAKNSYHKALGMIRQNCDHVSSYIEEHSCSPSVVKQEQSFLSSCKDLTKLLEYYRSLCNLALTYLNESVKDTEKELYGESDFHILYRCIPLFLRSLSCIRLAEKSIVSQRSDYLDEEREHEWYKAYSEILSFRCDSLSNLGLSYEDAGDLRQSTKYLYQCIYMKDSFLQLPKEERGDWEVRISRAKHSLGVCYMKMGMHEEAEKYLQEDIRFCEQRRIRLPLNSESLTQSCIAEGQTHQTLGTLFLHSHTSSSYQQAQRHYEEALSRFQLVAGHIPNSFIADAKQNLVVLKKTREEMIKYQQLLEKASNCTNSQERYQLWLQCCEEILKFEQYNDETPFIHLKETVEMLYGKESREYAHCVHLYAEFLYNLYSADEDLVKLNAAKSFCEEAVSIYEKKEEEEQLATTLDIYASILSAIHNPENDQIEVQSYLRAAKFFAKQGDDQIYPYLTCLSNLIIAYNRIGKHHTAKKLKLRTDEIRAQKEEQEPIEAFEEEDEDEVIETIPATIPDENDDDLFAVEGCSQNHSIIQPVAWESDEDEPDSDSNEDQAGNDFSILAEYEALTDERQLESEIETIVKEREEDLIARISNAEDHSVYKIRLQMHLATLYQESGLFEKAIKQFEEVVSCLEKSLQNEDIYHYALRCLCICLREVDRVDDAINILNKDIDVLVFRKTRSGGGEYRQYYDCEIQRSYEELGNSYMKQYDINHESNCVSQAESCYSRSVRAAERSDPLNLTGALVNLATAQEEKGAINTAEMTFKKAIGSWKEPHSGMAEKDRFLSYSHIARAWYNLTRFHLHQGLISLAIKDCEQAYHYDCQSNKLMDLCRTAQLYSSLLMEVLARDMEKELSLHCESLFLKLINTIKEMAKSSTLHEIQESSSTIQILHQQLDRYHQWTQSVKNWNSKNTAELCQLCIELTRDQPFPFYALRVIIPFIMDHLPSQSIAISTGETDMTVTPVEIKSWTLLLQMWSLVKECKFSEVFALIKKYPGFLTLQVKLPCETPSSIVCQLNEVLLERHQYPSTVAGNYLLDSPLSYERSTQYLSELRQMHPILPSTSQNKKHDHHHVARGIHKQTDARFQEGCEVTLENDYHSRKRNHEERERLYKRVHTVELTPSQESIHTVEMEPPSPHLNTSRTIQINYHVVIRGEEWNYSDVLPITETMSVDVITTQVRSLIKNDTGLHTDVLKITVNGENYQSSVRLKEQDEITAYCTIPVDQSVSDAFQFVCRKDHYRSSGMFSILQAINQPVNGNTSFQSIHELILNEKNLNDLDLYHLLLPLRQSLNNLYSINLEGNCFTDIGAELVGIWLMSDICPGLHDISIGRNIWHGKGLEKLLYALRMYNVSHLNINSLRMSDYCIQSVIHILKSFCSYVDKTSKKKQLLSFHCNHLCISRNARSLLFMSIDQLELDELEMEGVEIPQDIEFQFLERISKLHSLVRLNLSCCSINLILLKNLVLPNSLPSIEFMNLSNNDGNDISSRNLLLESALQFIQIRTNCIIDLRFMGIHYAIPSELQKRLLI